MDCTVPGQFSAERLLAFAGGELDQVLAAHLPSCAACKETLAGYTSADHAFRTVLYRADCPTTMALGELALDLLRPEQATIVRAHLAGCPYCGAEFAGLRDALRADPLLDLVPRPSPIRRLIARLLSSPAEVMAYGMTETEIRDSARIYGVEDIRISLTLALEEIESAGRWTLHGMVGDSDAESVARSSTAAVLLNGRHVAESPVDRQGGFIIAGLGEGTYDLELHLTDRLIALEELPIGGEWEPTRF